MAVEWWALQQILKNDRGGDLGGYIPPPFNWKKFWKGVLYVVMAIVVPVIVGLCLTLPPVLARAIYGGIVIVWNILCTLFMAWWWDRG